MLVKFGPAGMGGIKEAISNLEKYKSLGFTACEIAFTYGAYIKKKEDAEKVYSGALALEGAPEEFRNHVRAKLQELKK